MVNRKNNTIAFRFTLPEKGPRNSPVMPGAVARRHVKPDCGLENSGHAMSKKSAQAASGNLFPGHSGFWLKSSAAGKPLRLGVVGRRGRPYNGETGTGSTAAALRPAQGSKPCPQAGWRCPAGEQAIGCQCVYSELRHGDVK